MKQERVPFGRFLQNISTILSVRSAHPAISGSKSFGSTFLPDDEVAHVLRYGRCEVLPLLGLPGS